MYKYLKYKNKYLKLKGGSSINIGIIGRSFKDYERDLKLLDEQNIDKTILELIIKQNDYFNSLHPNIDVVYFIDSKIEDMSDLEYIFDYYNNILSEDEIKEYINILLNKKIFNILKEPEYTNSSRFKDNISIYILEIQSYILKNKDTFNTRLKVKILLKYLILYIHMDDIDYSDIEKINCSSDLLEGLDFNIENATNILKKYKNLIIIIDETNINTIFDELTQNIKIIVFDWSTMKFFNSNIIEMILNKYIKIYISEDIIYYSKNTILVDKNEGDDVKITYINTMIIKNNIFYKTLFNYILKLISSSKPIDIENIPDVVDGIIYKYEYELLTFENLLIIKHLEKKNIIHVYIPLLIFNSDVFDIEIVYSNNILLLPNNKINKFSIIKKKIKRECVYYQYL